MNSFMSLYKKFVKGTAWINRERQTKPFGHDPAFESEIWRFEKEVTGPLDHEWLKLTEDERNGLRGDLVGLQPSIDKIF